MFGLKLKPRKQIVDLFSIFETILFEIFIIRSWLDLLTALMIDKSIFYVKFLLIGKTNIIIWTLVITILSEKFLSLNDKPL